MAALGLAAAAASPLPSAHAGSNLVEFQPVANDLDRLTTIVSTPFYPGVLFIAEQPGRVRIVEYGVLRAAPFLDITDRTRSSGFEQGLTGFALSPACMPEACALSTAASTAAPTRSPIQAIIPLQTSGSPTKSPSVTTLRMARFAPPSRPLVRYSRTSIVLSPYIAATMRSSA